MSSIDKNRRHPAYEERVRVAELLWLSYAGGEAHKRGGFLDKYPRELAEVYEARVERSYYLNYAAAVVDAYVSAVFKRDPVREPNAGEGEASLEGALAQFQADATGEGTSLTSLMHAVGARALAMEEALLVVDLDSGGNPYVHILHPANLLDWSLEDSGRFRWAIIAEELVTDDSPFERRLREERYRLWTEEEWRLFDGAGSQVDSGRNQAGRVPIISVAGGEVNLPIYDIAEINKRIFNLCSQLDEMLINNTFPQRYMQGEGAEDEQGEAISPDVSPITVGTGRVLFLPEESTMPPGFLAPPDGPARLQIEERERLVSAIYSLAGLERKDPDSQNVQSGVAKAYDFREANQRLISLAQLMETTELEIFGLLEAYGLQANVNVTYEKDYHVQDFTRQIDDYEKITEATLPPEAKRRAAMEVAMSIAQEADESDRREIRRAVESMPDSAFSAARRRSMLADLGIET